MGELSQQAMCPQVAHPQMRADRAHRLQCLQQAGRVVAAAVHHAVDEQRRRSANLARGDPALDVAADPREDRGAGASAVECLDVESELAGVAQQVVVVERLLAVEEQLVHVPEAILQRGGLGGGGLP